MKPVIRVAYAYWWPGFSPDTFRGLFPYVAEKYELVPSPTPDVVFYSVFSPLHQPYGDPRQIWSVVRSPPGNYVRVFITGENFEPAMDSCDFAITFSTLTNHANHLRVPLWVYENRNWGYGADRLLTSPDTDWEKVAAEKTHFCNFAYMHEVPFRNAIFSQLNAIKHVDAPGACMHNMNGAQVPYVPNRTAGKLGFLRRYKFTLAVENSLWPGYMTEKLVDPMYVHSIPIYVGDPQARASFDPEGYIDFTSFTSLKEMLEFVREVDNNRDLYLKILSTPHFRGNTIPDYARDDTILSFFDRIFETAQARKRGPGGTDSSLPRTGGVLRPRVPGT